MFEFFKTRLKAAICARLNCQGYPHTCAHLHSKMVSTQVSNANCKGNIYCNERGQPSHAAVEGKGRIVLHHEPNQEQFDDSTEGLRRSGRRRWFIIYEQD